MINNLGTFYIFKVSYCSVTTDLARTSFLLPHTLLSILVNSFKRNLFFPVWNSAISELQDPTPEKDCHIKLHHTCGKKHVNMLLSADSLVQSMG